MANLPFYHPCAFCTQAPPESTFISTQRFRFVQFFHRKSELAARYDLLQFAGHFNASNVDGAVGCVGVIASENILVEQLHGQSPGDAFYLISITLFLRDTNS